MADGRHPAQDLTIRQALVAAGGQLREAGVDDAMLDAGLLLAHVIGGDRLTLIRDGDRDLNAEEIRAFGGLIAARAARQPVSRLLGHREFWSLDLQIDAAVLDPRPDSETIVAAALEQLPQSEGVYRIADLGTGSGCLLLALLRERPRAWGIGLDISANAIGRARENARALGLADRAHFLVGNWGDGLAPGFDMIVVNPPYIPSADIAGLAPEVRCHDPALALDGGADGLVAYRALVPDLRRLLQPNGYAVLECGYGQSSALRKIIEVGGLRLVGCHADLGGVDRCLVVSTKN